MFCTNCGSNLAEGARFCPGCGEAAGGTGPVHAFAAVRPGAAPVQAPDPPPQAFAYAGFWRRLFALLLDAAILVVPNLVFGGMIGFAVGKGPWAQGGPTAILAGQLVVTLISWLYFAGLESRWKQATFGKMALGIKVVDLGGARVSFLRATGRHFGKAVSALILSIGFLLAAFTSRKQALHDMMAGCLVVKK